MSQIVLYGLFMALNVPVTRIKPAFTTMRKRVSDLLSSNGGVTRGRTKRGEVLGKFTDEVSSRCSCEGFLSSVLFVFHVKHKMSADRTIENQRKIQLNYVRKVTEMVYLFA